MDPFRKKIQQSKQRFAEIQQQLQSPDIVNNQSLYRSLIAEHDNLKEKVALFDRFVQLEKALQEAKQTAVSSQDKELVAFAQAECDRLEKERAREEQTIKQALLPADPIDKKDIIMEIRAGAGGDEAALFAAELFYMYTKFAERQGWNVSLMNTNRTGLGGFKEVIIEISGRNVYSYLKYESGVHRVQRVPETEKSGRVHTSTVTVAVMPAADEVDVVIKPEDLRIDVFRSSGHGGQSVNTTDSAVRITYLPTGLIVTCQDEKSQHKNRAKAMKVLQSRLLSMKLDEERKKSSELRRSQIGTGDRSEKIRTYNFPQDRITDHRIKKNWSNMRAILEGNLESVITSVQEVEHAAALNNL